jgi:hypothetical protein
MTVSRGLRGSAIDRPGEIRVADLIGVKQIIAVGCFVKRGSGPY